MGTAVAPAGTTVLMMGTTVSLSGTTVFRTETTVSVTGTVVLRGKTADTAMLSDVSPPTVGGHTFFIELIFNGVNIF
jgi:hypothetical protein